MLDHMGNIICFYCVSLAILNGKFVPHSVIILNVCDLQIHLNEQWASHLSSIENSLKKKTQFWSLYHVIFHAKINLLGHYKTDNGYFYNKNLRNIFTFYTNMAPFQYFLFVNKLILFVCEYSLLIFFILDIIFKSQQVTKIQHFKLALDNTECGASCLND